ncbi:hypothetical protein OsI_07832 [Oryza sativa Indica Group]|uniref:Uncharacterized protein n=1 Tax=Oryza sativa subsp. indica TaxID=39946 RepID=A2X6J0_ORYSI|nr:hypothetical protein OsI_07832 [Oryza sativa Indica Group]
MRVTGEEEAAMHGSGCPKLVADGSGHPRAHASWIRWPPPLPLRYTEEKKRLPPGRQGEEEAAPTAPCRGEEEAATTVSHRAGEKKRQRR